MTSPLLMLAVTAVRWWTRLYTWGLPEGIAARRRAEIESDLRELQHDPDGGHGLPPAAQVCMRLVAGLAHDLSWRVEQMSSGDTVRRAVMVTTTAVLLLTTLWVVPLWSGGKPHQHCLALQQVEATRLNPSANCDCEQRARPSGSRVPRRDGAYMARVVCRP